MAVAQEYVVLSMREKFAIRAGRAERPRDLFPRAFEVTDAYITNAPSVSHLRHFYM